MDDIERKKAADALIRDHNLQDSEGFGRIEGLANQMEDSDYRDMVWSKLAQRLMDIGADKQAIAVANRINTFYDRVHRLLTIAEDLAQKNDFDGASTILVSVVNVARTYMGDDVWTWQRAKAMNRAAILFAQLDHTEEALRVWRDAVNLIREMREIDDVECSDVLAEISQSLALTGHFALATQAADEIWVPAIKSWVLQKVREFES